MGKKKAALQNNLGKSEKFRVIYNGLPEVNRFPRKDELRKKFKIPEKAIVVGNNARLSEQKDPLLFMNIAKNVINKNGNFHFVWAGCGPLVSEVKNFISKNNLEENIHLLGDRPDSQLIVAMYDLFFISSKYEGLPYAPIEALRAQVPVIGFDTVGVREVIPEQYVSSFLFSKDEIRKIIKLIIQKDYIDKNVKKVFFNLYKSKFNEKKMIENIEKEYISN